MASLIVLLAVLGAGCGWFLWHSLLGVLMGAGLGEAVLALLTLSPKLRWESLLGLLEILMNLLEIFHGF
jgi:hypothetical protein